MKLVLLIIAVLPVFLIGLYIYKKDKRKEPIKLLCLLFVFGILSCFPAAFIGSILSSFLPDIEYMNFFQLFIYVFVVVALVEELCKWFSAYKLSYNHNDFDSTYDMIVYSVFVALGFACFENILYVSTTGIETGIMRAFSAIPGHACDGIIMGLYLGMAKILDVKNNKRLSRRYKLMSIILPTITHGIYDYCLFVGEPVFVYLFIFFIISIDIFCINKVKHISNNSVSFKYNNNYCTNCGSQIIGNYCINCGKKIV